MKRIYIGNLSFSTTEDDLSKAFGEYGEVISVDGKFLINLPTIA